MDNKLLGLLKPFGSLFLPGGSRARLTILIYHRIMDKFDPFRPSEPTAELFDQQMRILSENFTVLPLDEAADRLYQGSLPPRSACITFDDGYTDNLTLGVDILKRHSLTATFFLTSGFIQNGRMWNDVIIESMRNTKMEKLDLKTVGLQEYHLETVDDRCKAASHMITNLKYIPASERLDRVNQIVEMSRPELPDNLMLTPEQMKSLHESGMHIGAHTVSHPILTRIDARKARQEIMDNKEFLEDTIKDRINVFAYPNGRPDEDYSAEHVRIIKQLGFTTAVSTAWGTARASCDRYQLPRFTPWDKSPTRFALRIYQNSFRTLPETILTSRLS